MNDGRKYCFAWSNNYSHCLARPLTCAMTQADLLLVAAVGHLRPSAADALNKVFAAGTTSSGVKETFEDAVAGANHSEQVVQRSQQKQKRTNAKAQPEVKRPRLCAADMTGSKDEPVDSDVRCRKESEQERENDCEKLNSQQGGSGSYGPQTSQKPEVLRKVYRSFSPLSVKLLPGIQLEAQLNRPWLSVAKSTLPNAGMGVFAKRSFPVAAILCKFEGSLLAGLKSGRRSKAQEGQSGGAGLQSADNRYVLSLCSGGWLLDGAPVARAIREGAKEVEIAVLTPGGEHIHQRRNLQDLGVGCMVNHGSRENANAKFVLIKTHRSGMLPAVAFLQATKDIAAGEELFTRYGNAESTAWG
eukprot:s2074_g10.t1